MKHTILYCFRVFISQEHTQNYLKVIVTENNHHTDVIEQSNGTLLNHLPIVTTDNQGLTIALQCACLNTSIPYVYFTVPQ